MMRERHYIREKSDYENEISSLKYQLQKTENEITQMVNRVRVIALELGAVQLAFKQFKEGEEE